MALDVLARWIDLPAETDKVRVLMDECGLEVKRTDRDGDSPVFTLELLANRGDHRCYEGVARELDGRLGVGLRPLEVPALELGVSTPIRVLSPRCLVYTATLLERRGDGAAPIGATALRVLEAAGIHSLSAPVDATNVVNLEIGQPTHAFDADTIEGVLTVRESVAGEKAWPLFQPEPVELPEGTLVIADERKILAIAGVIGCEESKTTPATRRLLLESAAFDPVAVRKARTALGIQSDAAARFERGSDPAAPLRGAARAVALLEATGQWARTGPTTTSGQWRDPGRVIALDVAYAGRFLAQELSPAEIAARLSRYGFSSRRDPDSDSHRLLVSVPSFRLWDVEWRDDLCEELAKSIGYDNIPTEMPPVDMGALPSEAETRKSAVESVLTGMGFYEVFTDGFYGRSALELLGIAADHPLARHVETTNALDRTYSLLKNNCLHQALEAAAHNERYRAPDMKIYEWTRTFSPSSEALPARPDPRLPPCVERKLLWAMVYGADRARSWQNTSRPADVHFLKGLIEEISVELGIDLELRSIGASADASALHPVASLLHAGRRALVLSAGRVVGVLGEVHPSICKRYKIKSARPCYLEIALEALTQPGSRPAYTEPEASQPLVRSVSLGLPSHLDTADVVAILHASGPDYLSRIDVVDLFVPKTDGPSIRSVTFELNYSNPDAQLTAEAVNAATEAMIRAVLDQFGSRGVHQR